MNFIESISQRLLVALKEPIEALEHHLVGAFPRLLVVNSENGMRAYPLYAYISVCEDHSDGDELLVLCVSIWTDGHNHSLNADLCTGTGGTLMEVKPYTWQNDDVDLASVDAWIESAQALIDNAFEPAATHLRACMNSKSGEKA
ncbi:MAG: hypothetical protein H6739_39670 [Alphaproteobacteria bacterium]|nr:hypothetical protein [Alphaproteobacteria bacterium]